MWTPNFMSIPDALYRFDEHNLSSLCTMQEFGTSVLNKGVPWHESGEVENVYMANNFSQFAIYLLKFIIIGGNLTKFWHKTIFHSFFWDTVYIYIYILVCREEFIENLVSKNDFFLNSRLNEWIMFKFLSRRVKYF